MRPHMEIKGIFALFLWRYLRFASFSTVGHENRDALERILLGSKGEPLLAHRQWSRDILRWHINDSKGFTFYHKRGPDVRWVNHSEQADTNKDNGAGRGQGPLLCVWESGITIPWMLFLFKKLMMRVDCECSSRLSPLIFFSFFIFFFAFS